MEGQVIFMAIIKTFKVLACCLKTPLVIPVPNPEKNDKKAIKKDTYFFLLIISPPLEVVAKASEKNGTTKTRRHKVYSGLAQAPPGRQKSLSSCLCGSKLYAFCDTLLWAALCGDVARLHQYFTLRIYFLPTPRQR